MEEEDNPPPLPKRPPTIIRPAPPVPNSGDSAPGPNGSDKKPPHTIPSRPAPPRPVPKIPTPAAATKFSAEVSGQVVSKDIKGQSTTSGGKSNVNNNSRRKLEITVVDARPMSEIGFRDIKTAAALDTQPKPNASSPQGKATPSVGEAERHEAKKEEAHPHRALPPRPSRPNAMPTPTSSSNASTTPPSSSKASSNELSAKDEASNASENNLMDCDKEMKRDSKSDAEETSPPKPKRPTIIRPQSKLQKQQAVTSMDVDSGVKEAKPVPPPLPSVSPSASPKVPPLPSRPPVASTPVLPPAVATGHPPPKPEAPAKQPLHPNQVRPAPRPRPRPRSTIIVSDSSLSEIFSAGDGVDIKSDPKSSKTLDCDNAKAQVEADVPQRPKRPTIIRPKSVALPASTQILSLASNPSEESPSLTSAPSIPARPQRPEGPKKIPSRPTAPPPQSSSISASSTSNAGDRNVYEIIDDQKDRDPSNSDLKGIKLHGNLQENSPKSSDNLSVEEPHYCRIVKPKPESTDSSPNQEQGNLKSSTSSTSSSLDEKSSGVTEELPPPLPPKINKKPISLPPSSKPLPQPKPKPKTKPKPKPKPSSFKSNDDPTEKTTEQEFVEGKRKGDIQSETLSTEKRTEHQGEEKSQIIPSTTECEQSNDKNQTDTEAPKHISAAFLSRFEAKETKDKEISDLKTHCQPACGIAEVTPPMPPRKPQVTMIGWNRTEEKRNFPCSEDSIKLSSLSSCEDDCSPTKDSVTKDPPAPKRPVTIIGRPKKTSQSSVSIEADSNEGTEMKKEVEGLPGQEEKVSSETDINTKPTRPPQIKRPPPPVVQRPSTRVENDGKHLLESSLTPSKQVSVNLNQNLPEKIEEEDQPEAVAPLLSPPPRPTGPPLPVPPPIGQTDKHPSDLNDHSDLFEESHTEDTKLKEKEKEVDSGLESVHEKVCHHPDVRDVDKANESQAPAPRPPRPAPVMLRKTSEPNMAATDSDVKEKRPPRPASVVPRKASDTSLETEPQPSDTRPPRPASVVPRKASDTGVETEPQPSDTRTPERPKPPKPQAVKSSTVPKAAPKSTGPPQLPPRPSPGHALYHYMANQPHGIATHDYTANHQDELSFKAGELVVITKEVNEEWLAGKLGNDEGIFPRDFMELKYPMREEEPPESDLQVLQYDEGAASVFGAEVTAEKPDTLTGPRCRARFDFEGEGEGELAIEDGDVIKLISHMGSEWMKGELNGAVGIFPSAFVEVIEDLNVEQEDINNSNAVSAMFDFDGQEGELSFQAGDTIEIKSQVNSEWLFGESGGKAGKFPAAFVSHVPPSLPQFTALVREELESEADKTFAGEIMADVEEAASHSHKDRNIDVPKMVIAYCSAIHDYESDTPGDLRFKVGDRIEVTEFVGDEWLQGQCKGKEGLFPSAFVKLEENKEDNDQHNPVVLDQDIEQTEVQRAIALHDFNGETDSDLSFKAGDQIEIHDFVDSSQEWKWGSFQGKRGMFPTAFVKLC